jgi:hypothetical protein
MQNERMGGKYDEVCIESFKKLIKSYEENGYNTASEIELNRNLTLLDGSHRMALALYYKINVISCKIRPYSIPVKYDLEWFIKNGFSLTELAILRDTYISINNDMLAPFICILWPPVQEYFDEIVEKINYMEKVICSYDYCYDDVTFEETLKNIYSVDDVAPWKIEMKLKKMFRNEQRKIRVVLLRIETPRFRLKANCHTLSIRGEEIKDIIRESYKNKIQDYFFDIIIHIGDNFYQNEYLMKLFDIKHKNIKE